MSKALLILGLGSVLSLPAAPPFALNSPNQTPNKHELRALARTTGDAMRLLLARRGVKTIDGKPLFGGHGRVNNPTLKDIPIAANPAVNEWYPDITANPASRNRIAVSAMVATGLDFVRCAVFRSLDAGSSWSAPVYLPQPNADSSDCTEPHIRYSRDGHTLGASFINAHYVRDEAAKQTLITYDVVVTKSTDNGFTWSTPVVAMSGLPFTYQDVPCGEYTCGELVGDGVMYNNNWIAVSDHGDRIYVASAAFPWIDLWSTIEFALSTDGGNSFSKKILQIVPDWPDNFMQAPRIAVGPNNRVLVAWYHSGNDGMLRGEFFVNAAYSANGAESFTPAFTALRDSYELPAMLGPDGVYQIWWGSSFPVIQFDDSGAAHMVYTSDPEANFPCVYPRPGWFYNPCSTTPEDGDIRYARSSTPPYTEWSPPITVNDDQTRTAQGQPVLFVESVGKQAVVHVSWMDARAGTAIPSTASYPECHVEEKPGGCDSPNMVYDIYYARLVPGAKRFSRNTRVNETTMWQAVDWTEMKTVLASTGTVLYGVIPDRRAATWIKDGSNDLFGTRILP